MNVKYDVAVITVSDRVSAGEMTDATGPAVVGRMPRAQFDVRRQWVVPDDPDAIREALMECVDEELALVITAGGTGMAQRDVTPEATLSVIDRRADGMAEAMRAASMAKTANAMLSRGICGTRGRTLIVNLPGSPKAAIECLDVVLPVLPHALRLLRNDAPTNESEHAPGRGDASDGALTPQGGHGDSEHATGGEGAPAKRRARKSQK